MHHPFKQAGKGWEECGSCGLAANHPVHSTKSPKAGPTVQSVMEQVERIRTDGVVDVHPWNVSDAPACPCGCREMTLVSDGDAYQAMCPECAIAGPMSQDPDPSKRAGQAFNALAGFRLDVAYAKLVLDGFRLGGPRCPSCGTPDGVTKGTAQTTIARLSLTMGRLEVKPSITELLDINPGPMDTYEVPEDGWYTVDGSLPVHMSKGRTLSTKNVQRTLVGPYPTDTPPEEPPAGKPRC
jgi:hypothetical protein